jgi:hypothetical protein
VAREVQQAEDGEEAKLGEKERMRSFSERKADRGRNQPAEIERDVSASSSQAFWQRYQGCQKA